MCSAMSGDLSVPEGELVLGRAVWPPTMVGADAASSLVGSAPMCVWWGGGSHQLTLDGPAPWRLCALYYSLGVSLLPVLPLRDWRLAVCIAHGRRHPPGHPFAAMTTGHGLRWYLQLACSTLFLSSPAVPSRMRLVLHTPAVAWRHYRSAWPSVPPGCLPSLAPSLTLRLRDVGAACARRGHAPPPSRPPPPLSSSFPHTPAPSFPGTVDAINFSSRPVYIITTKQTRFALALLAAAGVSAAKVPPERVFGHGSGSKIATLNKILSMPENAGCHIQCVGDAACDSRWGGVCGHARRARA